MRARGAPGVPAVAALAIVMALAGGCGGGGSGNSGTTAPPPPPALQITTTSLPNGVQGEAYNETFFATGGKAPYAWSATAALPFGLSLSPGGVLSGTLQGAGSGVCDIQVTDSSSSPHVLRQAYSFESEQILTLPMESLADTNVGQSYSVSFNATGGSSPFTWSLLSGAASLPPGFSFGSSTYRATISGVPAAAGTFDFTVEASEVNPPYQKAQQNYSLTVTNFLVVTTSTLPQGVVNKPYQAALEAAGGTPPYTWSSGANQLPTGLSLDAATGVISGTPTETTTTASPNVDFTVTDSSVPAQEETAYLQVVINPALHFAQTTLPDGVLSRIYDDSVPFVGGIGPYTAQIQGALPDGISIGGSGTNHLGIAGTPTTLGMSNFTLTIQDSESPPVTIQQAFSIRINPLLVVENTQPPDTIVATPYAFQFQATGGVPPYQWPSTEGSIPAGLTIDSSTGLMSGTSTTAGRYSFCVSASDSASPPQSTPWFCVPNFYVYDQLKVATALLAAVAANAPVNIHLGAFGGSGNYSWTIPSGALPAGLTMDSTGVISGQTTATGNFTFTAEVDDAGPPAQMAEQTLELTVSNSLGRNDTPGTATPLSNGTYTASISPIADPPNGVIGPDSDYYKLAANPGAIVTVEITAQRLNPPSPLDSVLELVDANGNRLVLCSSDPMNTSAGPFASACMNDDIAELATKDSRLTLQVPAGNTGPMTFYAHVLDWRGDARPDLVYTITVSGAN